jgi:hypothetical protein
MQNLCTFPSVDAVTSGGLSQALRSQVSHCTAMLSMVFGDGPVTRFADITRFLAKSDSPILSLLSKRTRSIPAQSGASYWDAMAL